MYIYIDESGGFIPLQGTKNRISAVAAIVVPTATHNALLARFAELRQRLDSTGSELKGSRLDEEAMAEIADLLVSFDVLGEVVAIDMGDLSAADVRAFQAQQAAIIASPFVGYEPDHVKEAWRQLSELTLSLSAQNFVQGFLMVALVDKLFRVTTAYHSQRDPRELAEFDWVIDAKGAAIAAVEQLWLDLVFPVLSVESRREPIGYIPWGDYSHFSRFETASAESSMNNLRIDPRAVLQQRRFTNSNAELGLQLADIFASAITRAFNQNLRPEGWRGFGRMLVHRNPGSPLSEAVRMVTLRNTPDAPKQTRRVNYHGWVLAQLTVRLRPMVPERFIPLMGEPPEV